MKPEGKENTELSVQGQFTQADIPNLLEKVNSKIKELTKNDTKVKPITVQLPGFGDISKNECLMSLIQACSSVEGKEAAYKAAATKYLPEGVKAPSLKINGHSVNEWLEFLKERITEVAHKNELEKLRKIKTTLEENLSQEAKLANDLKKISEILVDE